MSHGSNSARVIITGEEYRFYQNATQIHLGSSTNLWGLSWDRQRINEEIYFQWKHTHNGLYPNPSSTYLRVHEVYMRVTYGYIAKVISVSPSTIKRSGGELITVIGLNFFGKNTFISCY